LRHDHSIAAVTGEWRSGAAIRPAHQHHAQHAGKQSLSSDNVPLPLSAHIRLLNCGT